MTTTAPAVAAAPYVSLDRAGKTYASARGPVAALENISLDIRPREFVSVVGPSGCGKSTLLKLVAGLENVSSGKVVVGGKVLDGPPDDGVDATEASNGADPASSSTHSEIWSSTSSSASKPNTARWDKWCFRERRWLTPR